MHKNMCLIDFESDVMMNFREYSSKKINRIDILSDKKELLSDKSSISISKLCTMKFISRLRPFKHTLNTISIDQKVLYDTLDEDKSIDY